MSDFRRAGHTLAPRKIAGAGKALFQTAKRGNVTESDFDHDDDDDAAELAAELDDDTEYAADPAFDLGRVKISRKCWACGQKFSRYVSKRSARWQKLCSTCRHLSDPEQLPRLPSFEC